jgi:site-specific recombinase XerD
VLHGKGDISRTLAIDQETYVMIDRWIDQRLRLRPRPPRGAPLFCTLRGRPVSPNYFRQLLPRIAHRAGIEKRVHAHGLRHTFAAELAMEGHPVNRIQAALGHTDLSTTSRYLAHVAPQDVIDMLRRRPWREPLDRRKGRRAGSASTGKAEGGEGHG